MQTIVLNGVTVVGCDLVPKRVIDFIQNVLETNYKGDLNTIVFESNPAMKKEVFGMYYDIGRVIVVNLSRSWSNLIEQLSDVSKDTSNISIRVYLWHSVLNTILHEMLHNEHYKVSRETIEKLETSDEDLHEFLKDEASQMLYEIAKTYNIEPPVLTDWKFLEDTGMMTDIITMIDKGEEEWTKKQKAMVELKLLYSDDVENVFIDSFREYLRLASNDSESDVWKQKVKPLVEPEKFITKEIIEEDVRTSDDNFTEDNIGVTTAENMVDDGWDEEACFMTASETGLTHPQTGFDQAQAFGPVAAAPAFTPTASTPQPTETGFTPVHQPGNLNVFTIPQITLQPEEVWAIFNELFLRMCNRMFNSCQFRAGMDNPFAAPQNIHELLYIGDIPNIQQLLISCDMEDDNNVITKTANIWNPENPALVGHISGQVFKKGTKQVTAPGGQIITEYPMPGYKFTINKDGMAQQRLFIAQNVNKINAAGTGYSPPAIEARQGRKIAWLMNIEPNATKREKAIAKMVDGNLEHLSKNYNRGS